MIREQKAKNNQSSTFRRSGSTEIDMCRSPVADERQVSPVERRAGG
jgi:hypothetical protein